MKRIISALMCVVMMAILCSCEEPVELQAESETTSVELSSQAEGSSQAVESSVPELSSSSQIVSSSILSELPSSSEIEVSQQMISSSKTSSVSSEKPASSSKKPDSNSSGIKVDLFDGFCTVTLPASWEGRYVIEEGETDDGESYVGFYNKKNYSTEYIGWLFSIYKSSEYKNKSDFLENCPYAHWHSSYLAKWSDGIIYTMGPMDVQYDYENEKLAEDYNSMYSEVQRVLDSLVVNE